MAGRRRTAAPPAGIGRRTTRSTGRKQNPVPDIYREMLAEAVTEPTPVASATDSSSPQPLKRKRPGVRTRSVPSSSSTPGPEAKKLRKNEEREAMKGPEPKEGDGDEKEADEEDMDFEDVPVPIPKAQVQTTEMDSDDEDDDDIQFEDVDLPDLPFDPANMDNFNPNPTDEMIELNLTKHMANESPRKSVERRRAINKEEKKQRIQVHQMHILCLLAHVSRRNRWCNDEQVQSVLQPLLSDKIIRYLNPGENLSQFGQAESLKNGIKMVGDLFRAKFEITERGMKRTLWAEELEHLENYKLPADLDSTLDISDFLKSAESLEGSRDIGAQLFCALLRSAGVEARLVCSLQPLPFAAGSPTLPRPPAKGIAPRATARGGKAPSYKVSGEEIRNQSAPGRPSFVQRMGSHTRWLNYNFITSRPSAPSIATYTQGSTFTAKTIKESPFPIYWVEVLDVANQKWHPVDPIVTCSSFNPAKLEPPASDKENVLAYAIAFNEDGSARDVTRRYSKAYNAKTRRIRLEGLSSPTPGVADEARNAGERWLRRTLRHFRIRGDGLSDLNQIENNELNRLEAREPMPRNLVDFKDHPIYALKRHMRRHEVLVSTATPSGTVGAGQKGPLEKVYRRRDVRVGRSQLKWYRLGRIINPGETPVKMLPPRPKKPGRWDDDDDNNDVVDPRKKRNVFGEVLVEEQEEENVGTAIFTFEQTCLYVPPSVVDGKVSKNRFGNVEVFVSSMVPPGGAHVDDEMACRAAYVLNIDYAPAVVGFQFRGRHGTAVLRGAVVAQEFEEAVVATTQGFRDLEEERERERKERRAWRMWMRFLMGLRVRKRIWKDEGEEGEGEGQQGSGRKGKGVDEEREEVEDGGEGERVVVRRGRRGVVESEDEDGDDDGGEDDMEGGFGGGGFMVEDGDYGGGGFC